MMVARSPFLVVVRAALFAAPFAALLAVLARPAGAEEVVLRSGTRYDADQVEVLPGDAPGTGNVRFSFSVGAGRGTVVLPFDRLDPVNLFGLVLARTKPDDARGQLALGRFARERGLLGEAEARYRLAATLDPTLAGERDAGLLAVRTQRGEQALGAAEAEMKRGRSDLALGRAREVLATAEPGSPLATRAAGLVDLASRVVDRDRARLLAEEAARSASASEARKASFASALARADTAVNAAIVERTRVSDPATTTAEAIRALEMAEARLREGRRLLANAAAFADEHLPDVDGRDRDAVALLVATDVDLAELYRQTRRFDKARDYLRAAQVLDPQNARIAEIRGLVEQDLRTPPQPTPDPYDAPPVVYYGRPVLSTPVYRSTYYGYGSPSFFRGRWGNVRVFFRW